MEPVSAFYLHFKLINVEKFALLARMEAKPGKEQDVLAFIKSALPLVQDEPHTVRWYGWQIGPFNIWHLRYI